MAYKNKEDQRKNTNAWYQRNKERQKESSAKNKRMYRQKWLEYKTSLSCVKCGAAHPAIIDFHHVIRDESKRAVNRLIANGAYTAVFEEIKKCIPLCANCHRIVHWDEDIAKRAEKQRKAKAKKG
jgi:hypothetical protein